MALITLIVSSEDVLSFVLFSVGHMEIIPYFDSLMR